MTHPQPATPLCVYQLSVVLREVSPLIWRRLLVRSDTSIAALHSILQIVMDWSDSHLHRFRIHGKDYGIARLGGIGFPNNPHQVKLSDFRLHRREQFFYKYDFTDGWVLEVRLEDVRPLDTKQAYPICTAGRQAAPPEDCGGPLAYLAMLDRHHYHLPWEELGLVAGAVQRFLDTGDRSAIGDPKALRAAMECLKAYTQFPPDRFDRKAVNARLRQLASGAGGEA